MLRSRIANLSKAYKTRPKFSAFEFASNLGVTKQDKPITPSSSIIAASQKILLDASSSQLIFLLVEFEVLGLLLRVMITTS